MFRRQTQSHTPVATLYAIVFGSVYVKVAVLFLLGFILLQPVGTILAADEAAADSGGSDTVSEPEPEPEVAGEPEPDPEPEPEVVEEPEPEPEAPVETESETASESTGEDESTVAVEVSSDTESEENTQSTDVENAVTTENETTSTETETSVATETPNAATTNTDGEAAAPDAEATDEVGTANNGDSGGGSSGANTSDNETEVAGETNSETIASTSATNTSSAVHESETHATTTETAATTTASVDTSSSTPATTTNTTGVTETNTVITDEEPTTEESTTEATTQPETSDTEPTAAVAGVASSTSAEATTTASTQPAPTDYFINDDNRYQFGTTECVSVGDGAYYCSDSEVQANVEPDEVYAAQDADGDFEIFFVESGTSQQLTHNRFDDKAPQYDELTAQVVWHRLVEGRYQIMRYDLTTGEETQLTEGTVNNMEPMQVDGVAVWQRWVGDNWEIMMLQGGEMTQISHNAAHDVAPAVRDGYVIWHTTNDAGEKLLSVYELATGRTSTIADPDGGHVENPRFVLVYDTEYENGDRVTKQYDPKTGAVTPIGTDPAPAPQPLPDPEPTGETTALIQAKPPTMREEGGESDAEPTASSTPKRASVQTATTTSDTASTSEEIADVVVAEAEATSTAEILPLSEFDLIVEPYSAPSSTQATDSASSSGSVE